jgi:type II secretory pathway pseudopilin PulG
MAPPDAGNRRGISLLEVLISIGILAIGLTSVVALVPVGKSEAGRAVILDRASLMAANALSDAVTFGLTRPDSFTASSGAIVVFDPVHAVTGSSIWSNAAMAMLKPQGALASGTATGSVDVQVIRLFAQGRDDLLYTAPSNDDAPPQNNFVNGTRAFQGRTSCLISIARTDGMVLPLAAGDLAKITAVVFHNRDVKAVTAADLTPVVLSGTYNDGNGSIALTGTIPDRPLKEIIRPGTVVYDGKKAATQPHLCWSQVGMAAVDDSNPALPVVYVTFAGAAPITGSVQIVLDSVGLAERTVTLEGVNRYAR